VGAEPAVSGKSVASRNEKGRVHVTLPFCFFRIEPVSAFFFLHECDLVKTTIRLCSTVLIPRSVPRPKKTVDYGKIFFYEGFPQNTPR
jgi:hypothetical protein